MQSLPLPNGLVNKPSLPQCLITNNSTNYTYNINNMLSSNVNHRYWLNFNNTLSHCKGYLCKDNVVYVPFGDSCPKYFLNSTHSYVGLEIYSNQSCLEGK